MREILFRGKDIKDNWYEGLLAHNIAKDEWYISNKAGIPTAYQIRPETIGQYTGLDDKNGVPIFEGDIVRLDGEWEEYGGNIFTIVFASACFYLARNLERICFLVKSYAEYSEVIGNIYDNPELLK